MGRVSQKKRMRNRAAKKLAVLAVFSTALFLGALAGCSQQSGSNIASPLAKPKPTGTPEHPFLYEWGLYGSANGQFDNPSAVAVNAAGTTVYVADQDNDRIEAFSPSGGYLTQWACTLPAGLAVEASGNVDVTTQEYVQRFSATTSLLSSGGGPGTLMGQLSAPQGLGVDASGTTLFVAEGANQRVQGVTFVASSGVPSYGISEVSLWSLASGGIGFTSPAGLALGPSNSTLYVTDSGASRVLGLSLSSSSSFNFGSFGPNPGQFDTPQGISADPTSGNLYVADTGNNRIEEFDSRGNYLFQWGGPGTGNGFFHSPVATAVDSGGNIYVVDRGNNLIQKFGP